MCSLYLSTTLWAIVVSGDMKRLVSPQLRMIYGEPMTRCFDAPSISVSRSSGHRSHARPMKQPRIIWIGYLYSINITVGR